MEGGAAEASVPTDAPLSPDAVVVVVDPVRGALDRLVTALRASPLHSRLGFDVSVALAHAERALGKHPTQG